MRGRESHPLSDSREGAGKHVGHAARAIRSREAASQGARGIESQTVGQGASAQSMTADPSHAPWP